MRHWKRLAIIVGAYLACWCATVVYGRSAARSVARGDAGVDESFENWKAYSPAPFWVVASYDVWTTGSDHYLEAHYAWLPGRALEFRKRATLYFPCGVF